MRQDSQTVSLTASQLLATGEIGRLDIGQDIYPSGGIQGPSELVSKTIEAFAC